jgi:KUP system potassium uptake protein
MGHFGRRPIRLAWFAVALPALLCSYFGQGALLLARPAESHHPFYGLVPGWALIPVVVLATMATIIASQAVISGAFSLTRQAIQIGYLPRMRIVHTSAAHAGQIYVPQVNWLLMATTILLVLGFRSSSRLAAAYGVAVTTTMLVATILFYVVAKRRWRWNRWALGSLTALFLAVDLAFFGANIMKITHGAWFPLLIGGGAFLLMTTWKKGRDMLAVKIVGRAQPLATFLREVAAAPPVRVAGNAVFLSGNPGVTPPALKHNLMHNKVLHEQVAILMILTEEVPRVPRDEIVEVVDLGQGFYSVKAKFGFMENPHVPLVLELARGKGLDFALDDSSFFLGRERILTARESGMSRWRRSIFSFMTRNAVGATAFFGIPPDRVVELGAQVEI